MLALSAEESVISFAETIKASYSAGSANARSYGRISAGLNDLG